MVTLITGANGGLGRAVVQAFLESGATVFGADLTWKPGAPENPRFHAIEGNLAEQEECRRVVKEAGEVDALVHLVGGFGGGKPIAESGDDVWAQMMNMNLSAALMMFRAVLPQMLDRKRGRIVAIGSRAALEPIANFAAYNVSKAALVTLVKTLALELADSGITANVVLPSVIDTPANRAAMPDSDFSTWVKPESIANLLAWLVSDQASDINGAAIPIYGRVR